MLNNPLTDSYRWWRQSRYPATKAITLAREDVARGKRRYPHSLGHGPIFGAQNEDGEAWCEDTRAGGLRFVDYADQILGLRHTGWYTDDDCHETYRGAVWQWPARNGRGRYVAGYEDPNIKGAARLDIRHVGDDKADAARMADGTARIGAEREREYREQSDAGFHYVSLGEEAKDIRGRMAARIGAVKAEARRNPTLREMLCEDVRRARDRLAEIADKRRDLLDDYGRSDVFRDIAALREKRYREAMGEG